MSICIGCGVDHKDGNDHCRAVRRLQGEIDLMKRLLRCEITGNLCGTDARQVGFPCSCNTCRVHRGHALVLEK